MTLVMPPYSEPQALRPPAGGDWGEVLEPGERLLWTGRPDTGFHLRWKHLAVSAVGLVFLGLAIAFMVQAAGALRAGHELGAALVLFGLPLLGFGLWLVAGVHLADMLRRRGTRYALTDRRALIETDFLGHGLASYPITPDSPLWVAPGTPPSAYFAMVRPKVRPLERMRRTIWHSTAIDVGFEFIEDASEVHRMMQDIQTGLEP